MINHAGFLSSNTDWHSQQNLKQTIVVANLELFDRNINTKFKMDQPFDLAAHYDLLNEDDASSFALLRQRVTASQNNDSASTPSSNTDDTVSIDWGSDYWGSRDPWGEYVWLYLREEGNVSVSGLRRICYILRQNTLLKTLKVTGWSYPSNFYYDQALSGLLPCVGIQCNRSIERLSMEYIRLGSSDNFHKVQILGSFLRDNPSLRGLTLYNCCLDMLDLDVK